MMRRSSLTIALLLLWTSSAIAQQPPRLNIYHFDVNTGDATLIITPGGRGILIDGGNTGRGLNPILEFMNRAKMQGRLDALEYTIATHYDADHVGGLDEVLKASGWYPEIAALDRGNTLLPPFDRAHVQESCKNVDVDEAEKLAPWSTPVPTCPLIRHASCAIIDYFFAAKAGGRHRPIEAGEVLEFDNGIRLVALVVNARDLDGDMGNIQFPGRRPDCASNDLSIGLMLEYGRFRYLIAGDLTGETSEGVADIEELIKDDATELDIYHINHHGSDTSSSDDFMKAIHPTVVVVSNGRQYSHPSRTVIENHVLTLNPQPAVYLTNRTMQDTAWHAPDDRVADEDYNEFDGMIELAVWRESYRVYRWRNGARIDGGDRYFIKPR